MLQKLTNHKHAVAIVPSLGDDILTISRQNSGAFRDNHIAWPYAVAFGFSLVAKAAVKDNVADSRKTWRTAFATSQMWRYRARDDRDFLTCACEELETLTADAERVPAADFNDAKRAVRLDLADHKADLIHVRRHHDPRSICLFRMSDPKEAAQPVGHQLIYMRGDFFSQIIAHRRFMTRNR